MAIGAELFHQVGLIEMRTHLFKIRVAVKVALDFNECGQDEHSPSRRAMIDGRAQRGTEHERLKGAG